jgi:kynureninase
MHERCRALDAQDPLAHLRDAFDLPEDVVYLDGNSLGALPHAVRRRLRRVVDEEWGRSLVSSWSRHGWIDLPVSVGEKLARLVGAAPGQVVCTDSVSVNVYKLLDCALRLRPGRSVVVSVADNFPTDVYMAEGLAGQLGPERCALRLVDAADLESALGPDVAVLMLTQVDFRTGALLDIERLTARAHAHGALALWDLSHSAGVVPLALDAWGVDLAVGCGYKYLNGGPGAPAFIYLGSRHHEAARQPLTGWMGHERPFDFAAAYRPAAGARRFLSGTPGVLGMAALDEALGLFDGVSVEALRRKSLALGDVFIEGVDATAALGEMRLLTPREHAARGSQVSLAHPRAWAVTQALIEAGVVVDFRAPDIVRFGFSPIYNRFADVAAALAALEDVLTSRRYEDVRFQERKRVT